MDSTLDEDVKTLCDDLDQHRFPFTFVSWGDKIVSSASYNMMTIPSHIIDGFYIIEKIIEILSSDRTPEQVVKFVSEMVPIKTRFDNQIMILPPKFVNWNCTDEWSLLFDDRCKKISDRLMKSEVPFFFAAISGLEVIETQFITDSQQMRSRIRMSSIHAGNSDFVTDINDDTRSVSIDDILHILTIFSELCTDNDRKEQYMRLGSSIIRILFDILNVNVVGL